MRYLFQALLLVVTMTLSIGQTLAQQNDAGRPATATSYTTVTGIKVTPLSNGVQVAIQADGLLEYRSPDIEFGGGGGGKAKQIALFFPQAKNGIGKSFINVNRYPVSHIALSTPQGAVSGIGLNIVVHNLTEAGYQITGGADSQSVLITVLSDRTIETRRQPGAAQAAATDPNKPDTSTQVTFADGKLSVRAVRADIHSLMGLIAEKTGLTVAVDDAVERKVTINLAGVAPQVAVQAIATANGLALSPVGNLLVLSEGVPTDLATYRVSGTQSYRMQNTQAATASGLLPNFLYSYVKVNPEQNAVVVSAPTQMLAKIGQDLGKVDTPSPQILIEAIAVELTDDALSEFNLNLVNQRSTSVSLLDPLNGLLFYDTVGKLPQAFSLTLHALEKSGRARVRARPQMAVVNGKTANLFIGAQRFILTQFNQFGQTQQRIQPVDVGVKLAVTPLTGGNGEITTTLAPEVSNITEQDPQTGLPVLSTRNAATTVRVRDGETIVIGGLALDQELIVQRKMPLLGDLPLIGQLFRSRTRSTTRTDLVVFVTPHILPTTAPAVPANPPKEPK
jgi:type II secretory pathway component GspD/PulD (secretin)